MLKYSPNDIVISAHTLKHSGIRVVYRIVNNLDSFFINKYE